MFIVAKTTTGQEYFYSKKDAFCVSKAAAEKIRDICNNERWRLKDNETWHVYEIAEFSAPAAKMFIRKGIVKAVWY